MRELAGARCSGIYLYPKCVKPDISTMRARIVELASGPRLPVYEIKDPFPILLKDD